MRRSNNHPKFDPFWFGRGLLIEDGRRYPCRNDKWEEKNERSSWKEELNVFLFIRVSHKRFYLIGHLYINTQAYLLALLWLYICFRVYFKVGDNEVSFKTFFFGMDSVKGSICGSTLCFKKKGKIVQTRFVNESGATTVRNWFERFRAGNFDSKSAAIVQQRRISILSRPCSLKI